MDAWRVSLDKFSSVLSSWHSKGRAWQCEFDIYVENERRNYHALLHSSPSISCGVHNRVHRTNQRVHDDLLQCEWEKNWALIIVHFLFYPFFQAIIPRDAAAKCNQMKVSTAYENIFDPKTLAATAQLSTGEKELGLYCAIKMKDEREHCVEMNVATRRNKHQWT